MVASCFDQKETRRLITAQYSAERTGKGLFFESRLVDQGASPSDRIPAVMAGVARRGPEPLGPPGLIEIGGGAAAFDAVMAEFSAHFFEEPLIGRQQ